MDLESVAQKLAKQVKDSLAVRDGMIFELTRRLTAIEERPVPKDGRDGKDGEKGDPGDVKPLIEAFNDVVLRVESVEDKVEKVASRPEPRDGRDGIQGVKGDPGERGYDGRDGADGWSPDHVEMTIDDEGQWEFKMVTGDKVKSFTGRIPVNVDRGVFSNEASYAKGHMVTYGGDVWVCKEDNPGPPGKDFAGWRLAVRKGRDAPRAKV